MFYGSGTESLLSDPVTGDETLEPLSGSTLAGPAPLGAADAARWDGNLNPSRFAQGMTFWDGTEHVGGNSADCAGDGGCCGGRCTDDCGEGGACGGPGEIRCNAHQSSGYPMRAGHSGGEFAARLSVGSDGIAAPGFFGGSLGDETNQEPGKKDAKPGERRPRKPRKPRPGGGPTCAPCLAVAKAWEDCSKRASRKPSLKACLRAQNDCDRKFRIRLEACKMSQWAKSPMIPGDWFDKACPKPNLHSCDLGFPAWHTSPTFDQISWTDSKPKTITIDPQRNKCGANITPHLLILESQISHALRVSPRSFAEKICEGRWAVGNGWDICQLAWQKNIFCNPRYHSGLCHNCQMRFGLGGRTDALWEMGIRRPSMIRLATDRDRFRSIFGTCDGTVTVGGVCIRAEAANYFLWGVLSRECNRRFLGMHGYWPFPPFLRVNWWQAIVGYRGIKYQLHGMKDRLCGAAWGYHPDQRWSARPVAVHGKPLGGVPIHGDADPDGALSSCAPCNSPFLGNIDSSVRTTRLSPRGQFREFVSFKTGLRTAARYSRWNASESRTPLHCPPQPF